ncbi:hypothetical protein ScPMuIL_003171 [Solemya velum]
MPALIERPKMTKTMYQALKRHIMRERDRKKQEQEQDAMMEQQRKERQLKKKKEEEDNLTLGQTREQILQLDKKLEDLTQEKHILFSQLKKLLHQEEESRRRIRIKEQSELMSLQQAYPQHTMPVILQPAQIAQQPGQIAQPPGQIAQQQAVFRPTQQALIPTGVKRTRSPSPVPASSAVYPQYHESKIIPASIPVAKQQPAAMYTHQSQGDYKPAGNFSQSQPAPVSYVTQPGHSYPQPQAATGYTPSKSSAGKYNPSSQSAFTSYQSHYTHQQAKQITEPYPRYPMQRVQQPGYMGSPHASSIPLQQQLEHANQKAGFSEDKYKLQQQQTIRGVAPHPGQQPSLISQSIQIQQQPQPKGSIVTGFSARGQAPPQQNTYQAPASQASYPAQQGTPVRYAGHTPGRYF